MKVTLKNIEDIPISCQEQNLLTVLLKDLEEINNNIPNLEIHEIYIDWIDKHTEYSPERVDPCPDYYGYYRLWQGNKTLGIEMDLETLDYVMCVLNDIYVNN